MSRKAILLASAALIAIPALAATPEKKPVAKPVKVAKASMTSRSAAPAAAAAAFTPVALTPGQLEAANRVYTGGAACEFNQQVHVTPIDGQPGHFKLVHGKSTYTVVPEETTTGAVRLEDRKAGVVWLQIPAKSMLMNSRLGQRVVDSCMHPEQRNAAAPAGGAIGIETAAATATR